MKQARTKITLFATLVLHTGAVAMCEAEPDPHGIAIKTIPEKLVVLTFYDAFVSHVTFVGPLLKRPGFRGTFYITEAFKDKTNGGKPNDRCNEAFAELIRIYHAENVNPALRPPLPYDEGRKKQ